MIKEVIKLNNGVEIPTLGLGTWQTPDETAEYAVKSAIDIGYKHIDTAIGYRNECGVGRGIKNSGIDRKDLFVTSKILAECKNYDDTKMAINESLARLGCDYIDLMLIHAPRPWDEMNGGTKTYDEENLQVWRALEEGYENGKIRAIGVSNFSIRDLKNIVFNAKIKPFVNQICCHAGEVPMDIIEYCKSNDMVVEAYSPIGTGRLLNNEKVKKIADKYSVSVSRLCIKFVLQLGLVAIPKSTHSEYIKDNARLDFEIQEGDMQELFVL